MTKMTEKRDKEFIYKIAIGTFRKYGFKLSFVMGYGLPPMERRPRFSDPRGSARPWPENATFCLFLFGALTHNAPLQSFFFPQWGKGSRGETLSPQAAPRIAQGPDQFRKITVNRLGPRA